MPTILTGFLEANLLPIGEDDAKLKLLEDAAADLAEEIGEKPILAYRLAMVGMDERVPSTDPVHVMVNSAITTKWQTMTNKTGAGPVQVHRAVMLRAIELAAAKDSALQLAVTLTARNQSSPPENDKGGNAIRSLVDSWESAINAEISEAWVNPVDMSLPKLSTRLRKPSVSKEDLALGLARAVGPTDRSGNALDNPNTVWPNSGQSWAHEFVARATEAIQASIVAGTKTYAEDMQSALREIVQTWASSLEKLALRDSKAELLWIRASMYSPSARTTYRSQSPEDVVLNAVVDISRAVPPMAPTSVEHFLRDLVAELTPKRKRLNELLTAIGPVMAVLPEGKRIVSSEELPPKGRRSWLDYAIRGKDGAPVEVQIGVAEDHEDALAEFAVRFYRELQIRKLLARVV